jgi:hypothetical protein
MSKWFWLAFFIIWIFLFLTSSFIGWIAGLLVLVWPFVSIIYRQNIRNKIKERKQKRNTLREIKKKNNRLRNIIVALCALFTGLIPFLIAFFLIQTAHKKKAKDLSRGEIIDIVILAILFLIFLVWFITILDGIYGSAFGSLVAIIVYILIAMVLWLLKESVLKEAYMHRSGNLI